MSIIWTLYLTGEAGSRDRVAGELYEIIRTSLADDRRAEDLVERHAVLLSGLLVGISHPYPRRGPIAVGTDPGAGAATVEFWPAVEVDLQPGKAYQLGIFDRFGYFEQWAPQHEDIVRTVVALLDRVAGSAVLSEEGAVRLLRHDGRLHLTDRLAWDSELLAMIPEPYEWSPLELR